MTNADRVPVSQFALAHRLRQIRKDSGLSGVALAANLGWQQSKVSRIENNRQTPTDDDVAAWAGACDVGQDVTEELLAALAEALAAQEDWRQRAKAGQEAIQRDHDELGRTASVIRNVENVWIPGLLQTPEYARARIIENAYVWDTDPTDIDLSVMLRMQRQQILYDASKRFEFVITEAVLRLLLCPPEAMRSQLDRLVSVAGLPNVTLAVIPHGVPLPKSPAHAFILYDDIAVTEIASRELRYYGEEAGRYSREMDLLLAEAAIGHDARRLLMAAIEALPVIPPTTGVPSTAVGGSVSAADGGDLDDGRKSTPPVQPRPEYPPSPVPPPAASGSPGRPDSST